MKECLLNKTEIEKLIRIRTKFLTKQIDKLKGRIDLLERRKEKKEKEVYDTIR